MPAKYRELYFTRDQNADAYILNKKGGDVSRENYRYEPKSPEFCTSYGLVGETALPNMPRTYL